jgi:hypothetical protein
MKNRKNILVFILSMSLATAGTVGLTVLTTESDALAQSSNPSSAQLNTNTAHKEKSALESMISTYTTPISIILSAIGGVVTYSINESWKRRQYLEEKVKDFEGKIETTNIRKMLSAELQCVELFPFLEKPTHRFVVVEDCLWAEALLECKCNKTLKEQYSLIDKEHEHFYQQKPAVKACIRDNFNRYLNHLQQFEKMIESRIVNQETLKIHLEPWLEFIDRANNGVSVKCPSSGEEYLPKQALLEYMGLLENTPEEELSIIQKDVRTLVSRFRPLSSFTSRSKQTSTTIQCETLTTVQSHVV